MRHIVTNLAAHIRDALPRHFSELAVFDARLYIRVCRIDEPASAAAFVAVPDLNPCSARRVTKMIWSSNRGQDRFDGLLFVACDFPPRRFLVEKPPTRESGLALRAP
jgi:hypothetical protein